MSSRTTLNPPTRTPAVRRPLAQRVWRRLGQVALVLLALMLAGAGYEAASERADARHFVPAGQLIDVGGYRLHLQCLGQGTPVVVIDAGWGDWSLPWRTVQERASRTTTVCTYDRAGMGQSGAGPPPRDAAPFAAELHTLLGRVHLPGPYVLVGHSLGGLTVRVFTRRYPAEVQGAVLIESMALNPGPAPHSEPTASPQTLSLQTIPARLGLVRLLAGPLTQGVPANLWPQYAATIVTPRYAQTSAEEGAGMLAGLRQAVQVTSFGNLLLIVLSRGQHPDPAWQAKQTALLQLSSRSEARTVAHSGHGVQTDEPAAAVAAIARIISLLR